MKNQFPASLVGIILILGTVSCQTTPGATDVSLPILFTDHMVLQRDEAIKVWGTASPGGRVSVHLQDVRAETVAAEDSSWEVTLAPMAAGGPYTMRIAGRDTLSIEDVLVGDVWIGSGQSNMQWSVQQSNNAGAEIKAANYPKIRLFSVDRTVAARPRSEIPSDGWHLTTPETIPGFSAVAYFFGRSLHDSLDIPIGIIHSSWGGTVAEAWVSANTLREMPDFQGEVARVESMSAEFSQGPDAFQAMFDAWLEAIRENDRGYSDENAIWAAPELDHANWPRMTLPALWEADYLPGYDGAVWFRRTIQIPESWAGRDLTLRVGKVDDSDITWFNGLEVGRMSSYEADRVYSVPASAVRSGANIVTVRALDTGGGGGIWGEAAGMRVEPADRPSEGISLAGAWRYNTAVPLDKLDDLRPPPANQQNTVTVLYNAMIHPLIAYKIKGFIWYQGESNAGRAYQYRTLFPALIDDWRKLWQKNLPFMFVQLASFREKQQNPSEDETWPELREAQTMALEMSNTGMAVILDIGEADDIHPRNKQDVGARLARAALNVTYGHDIVAGGPLYREMKIEADTIRLAFDQVGGGLVTKGDQPLEGFAIAGEDSVFHWADAHIRGQEVVVSSPDVQAPVAVRYGWADNPIISLYNTDGLPASPFRTDDWPGVTEGAQ